MTTERTITVKAADGTLTIADLRAFLEEFDAATADPPSGVAPSSAAGWVADVAGAVKPRARVSFGGHIKSLTVTVPE